MDATGEHKTKYEYVPGTNIVRTEIYPNGSKLSYGHDLSDTVTSITQSTEEGEENSNQTIYTCGKATEIRSGNNVVTYEYDHKGRITKVGLNGNAGYQSISYTDDTTESGITGKVDKAVTTNAEEETFTSITDKSGNVCKVLYGTEAQVTNSYQGDKLTSMTDAVSGTFDYTYNSIDQLTEVKKDSTVIESYGYDDYGNQIQKTIADGVGHTYNYKFN